MLHTPAPRDHNIRFCQQEFPFLGLYFHSFRDIPVLMHLYVSDLRRYRIIMLRGFQGVGCQGKNFLPCLYKYIGKDLTGKDFFPDHERVGAGRQSGNGRHVSGLQVRRYQRSEGLSRIGICKQQDFRILLSGDFQNHVGIHSIVHHIE